MLKKLTEPPRPLFEAAPDLLPDESRQQLRLEDLLGFRRNPVTRTPLFLHHQAKALDGHPTPATPFIRVATGASGVGVPSSFGLALGATRWDVVRYFMVEIGMVSGAGLVLGLVGTAWQAARAMRARDDAQSEKARAVLAWNQADELRELLAGGRWPARRPALPLCRRAPSSLPGAACVTAAVSCII